MYFRARYYDPTTGEFCSRDPLEYVDGMSQYRGYFATVGVDPFGFFSETNKEAHAGHKYGATTFSLVHFDPRLLLLNPDESLGTVVPIGKDTEFTIPELALPGGKFKQLGLHIGADVKISSWHTCADCYWGQLVGTTVKSKDGEESTGPEWDGGAKRYPFQKVGKNFAIMEDHPGLFFGHTFYDFLELYGEAGTTPPVRGGVVVHFPKDKIDEYWQSIVDEQSRLEKSTTFTFFSILFCEKDGVEETVGMWQWKTRISFSEGEVANESIQPVWKNK
jgi:RHS repeat-associated protein